MKSALSRTATLEDGTSLSVWKDGQSWFGEVNFKTVIVKLGPLPSGDVAMHRTAWLSGSKRDVTNLEWEDVMRSIPD